MSAGSDIKEEYYFSMLLDRANRTYLAMASVEGWHGYRAAGRRRQMIWHAFQSPTTGLNREVAEQIAKEAKFADDLQSGIADVLVKLGEVFEKKTPPWLKSTLWFSPVKASSSPSTEKYP